MKIGILSWYPLWQEHSVEEQRLLDAAEEAGHDAKIIRAHACQLRCDEQSVRVLHEGEVFPEFDVLIPRARIVTQADSHLAILKQLEFEGVRLLNSYQSIVRAKNKLRTQLLLQRADVPVPRTLVLSDMSQMSVAERELGGFPLILKDPHGTYGRGVILVESLASARSAVQTLMGFYPRNILVQEFLKKADGKDRRLFVVDGKVVAAMERGAQAGEFRSNVELGGEARPVEPTEREREVALSAVAALDLHVAGVDLIDSERGPLVLEVNANPGFKALEAATGVDVAGDIIASL